jgi:hypothetical protein
MMCDDEKQQNQAGNRAHRNGTCIGTLALPFGAQGVEGMGGGTPDGRAKRDFCWIKSREKFDGIGRMSVVGVADARQQPQECGMIVRAQDGQLPQYSLRCVN